MNITVEIKAPELAAAIQALASAMNPKLFTLQKDEIVKTVRDAAPVQPVQPQAVQAPTAPATQAVTQPGPTPAPSAPVQPAPVQPAVPTSAPTYNMDQLAVAATQLMDAGKQPELLQLLSSFGVQALMQLPKEQYGAFATKLRELGAKI